MGGPASSPLILGTDLTSLDQTDVGLLKNTDVIAVDQDSIEASRLAGTSTQQVFAKIEPNGDVIVGLFNTTTQPEVVSTTASALGLASGTDYYLNDLWAHHTTETAGTVSANVPPHGVALYRVSPDTNPYLAPPNATMALTGLSAGTAGQPMTATETFTDNGDLAAKQVHLGLNAPSGWTVTATSATTFPTVETGQAVQATFSVVAPVPSGLFHTDQVTGTAAYTWSGKTQQNLSVTETVITSPPVQPPYQTFSSATDAQAAFGQSGQEFGIMSGGADVWTSADAYSAIYLKGAVGSTNRRTAPSCHALPIMIMGSAGRDPH